MWIPSAAIDKRWEDRVRLHWTRNTWILVLIVLATGWGGVVLGQETAEKKPSPYSKKGKDKPGHPGAPGSHHARMSQLVGSWHARTRLYPAPDAEPIEMHGSVTNAIAMDGRFLRSDFVGEMQGRRFTGLGISGFDNARQLHVGSWIDSTMTEIQLFTGSCDDEGRVITTFANAIDLDTGAVVKVKGITRIRSGSMYTYESWQQGADGEYRKTMEIIYTRE